MKRLAVALALAAMGCGELPARMPPHATSKEQAIRPTDPNSGLQFSFSAGEVVEAFDSLDGGFKIHFTRAGKDAVLAGDANDSGVPDFVEDTANIYDDVDHFYAGLGFRHPLSDQGQADNGGDGRFDVYLIDFATSADGAFEIDQCPGDGSTCYGYVSQENDFINYPYPTPHIGTITLGSHEYFHAIQSAYDWRQGVVIQEGTAVLGEEEYDPSLNDFEGFIYGYLSQMNRPLDQPPPGPVPEFAYGSAIWFRFLTERFDRATVRKIWEHCAEGQGYPSEPNDQAMPGWMVQQDAMLKTDYGSSFAQAFTEFATWNLFVGAAADAQHYANGANYPLPTSKSATSLPFNSGKLLVFHASAQYFDAPINNETQAGALLASADPAQTASLKLVVAVRRSGHIVAVQTAADPRASTLFPVQTDDQLIAIVVDGERGGMNAYNPTLCLGAPGDLAACAAALDPDAGMPMVDAGTPDAGAPDAGNETPLDVVPLTLGKAVGCSAAPGGMSLLLLLVAVAIKRKHPLSRNGRGWPEAG